MQTPKSKEVPLTGDIESSKTSPDNLVAIGHIRRAVGLDGRVEVDLYSGDISRLAAGTVLIAGDRNLIVEKASPSRKGLISVRFQGVKDRNASDLLRGLALEIPESALPPTAEGTYYHYQIIGSSVVDLAGRQLGSVSGIMETGANDVYVVSQLEGGDILVPATRNIVKEIDIVNKVITVDLPGDEAGSQVEEDRD